MSFTLYHTPRSLAILKGSTNRVVSTNYWVERSFAKIGAILGPHPDRMVVVTDLRYRSELQQFKERFGDQVVSIRINRFKDSPSTDASERDMDDQKFDYVINNTGTLEEAYAQMERILDRISENKAMDELAEETEKLGLEFK
jgi:hypothetical protein